MFSLGLCIRQSVGDSICCLDHDPAHHLSRRGFVGRDTSPRRSDDAACFVSLTQLSSSSKNFSPARESDAGVGCWVTAVGIDTPGCNRSTRGARRVTSAEVRDASPARGPVGISRAASSESAARLDGAGRSERPETASRSSASNSVCESCDERRTTARPSDALAGLLT
jgi:hypothetical protein